MEKKGQVTIFIIIAIVIFVAGLLIYLFVPQVKSTLSGSSRNPETFIYECVEEEIRDAIKLVSLRGGSITPKHYTLYDNEMVEYLCYTNEYYSMCVVQQPMLNGHIEREIKDYIEDNVRVCFDSLKKSLGKKGFSVNMKEGPIKIELLPNRVVSTFNYSLTLTKGDTEKYDSFSVVINNNLYELMSIANSILKWETLYGDADTNAYMLYYHYLDVKKKSQSDGTKVYIISDLETKDKFQFASRSKVWPPGYD
jgi:hypothetical protein